MMIFRTVHLSGGSGEVEVRLKCRLGASHPKIAENNVALTTIAIDVPQCRDTTRERRREREIQHER